MQEQTPRKRGFSAKDRVENFAQRWTEDELRIALAASQYSLREAADLLGRTRSAIMNARQFYYLKNGEIFEHVDPETGISAQDKVRASARTLQAKTQAETLATARNKGKRWTEADIRIAVDIARYTAAEAATHLQRTVYAVNGARVRWRLEPDGTLTPRSGAWSLPGKRVPRRPSRPRHHSATETGAADVVAGCSNCNSWFNEFRARCPHCGQGTMFRLLED